MRAIDIGREAISNTSRSKLRTSLTVVAIFIGAFTLTITSAIGTGVSSYIDTQLSSIGANDVFTVSKFGDAGAAGDGPAAYDPKSATAVSSGQGSRPGTTIQALSAGDLTEIAATKGILKVDPSVRVSPDYIEYDGQGKFQVNVNPSTTPTTADLAAGSQLRQTGDAGQILLPTSYLESLGFADAQAAVGQSVTLAITDYAGTQQNVQAVVAGVQNETILGSGVTFNQPLIDQMHTIELTGRPTGATEAYATAIAYFDADASPEQVSAIKADLSDQGYTAQTVADQIGAFQTVVNGIIGVLNAFAVIALIAAGFGIINTLLMSVQERTREIGLMKAMGMSGSRVYALFSTEAVFIGFLGSAIGAVAAIGLGTVISNVLADTVLSGLPGLQIMQFAPSSIATIIAVVMAIAFLAGTLPARRAAKQNPIDALRYE
ncbi:MAG: FtsX-like permease family protein [Cryobacterium sp.]